MANTPKVISKSDNRMTELPTADGEPLKRLLTESAALRLQVALFEERLAKLEQTVSKQRALVRFGADDASFLIWVLGFTAGAHLERDGERGERIFSRCRDLVVKTEEQRGANPS